MCSNYPGPFYGESWEAGAKMPLVECTKGVHSMLYVSHQLSHVTPSDLARWVNIRVSD